MRVEDAKCVDALVRNPSKRVGCPSLEPNRSETASVRVGVDWGAAKTTPARVESVRIGIYGSPIRRRKADQHRVLTHTHASPEETSSGRAAEHRLGIAFRCWCDSTKSLKYRVHWPQECHGAPSLPSHIHRRPSIHGGPIRQSLRILR